MSILLIVLPFVFLIASVFAAIFAVKKGVKPQRAIAGQIASFFVACIMFTAASALNVGAETNEAVESTKTEQSAKSEDKSYLGWGFIAAALAVGLPCIGCGIAVGSSAPAAIAACSENPKTVGKSLLFIALGEGIALYGILIAILILMVKMP